MQITYELTIKDWLEFQKNFYSKSKNYKKAKIVSIFAVPILLLFFLAYDYLKNEVTYVNVVVFIIFSAIWIIFWPDRFDKINLKYAKKMFNEGDNKAILGKRTIQFFDKYYLTKSASGESKIFWSYINNIEETKDYLFIYTSSVSACIIPKKEINEKISEFIKSRNITNSIPVR